MKPINRSTKSQVAIFWDWQNCRFTEEQVHLFWLFAHLMGSVVLQNVYSDWNLETNRRLYDLLYSSGFELPTVPSYKHKPNRTDQRLIRDCAQILNNPAITTVILLSGDGGFTPLVRDLRARGKKVVVISVCPTRTSEKLMIAADEFHFISQIESIFRSLPFAA